MIKETALPAACGCIETEANSDVSANTMTYPISVVQPLITRISSIVRQTTLTLTTSGCLHIYSADVYVHTRSLVCDMPRDLKEPSL